MKQAKWLVIPAIMLLFGWFWSVVSEEEDHGYGGQFNLVNASLSSEVIPLNGQWLFYPNQLIEPQETVFGGYDVRLVDVPHSFTESEFGTYQTDINLAPEAVGELLSLYIPNLGSAYKVWVNDDLLIEERQVGASRETTVPAKKAQVLDFRSDERMVTITIQVANHYLRKGGLWTDVLIADNDTMARSYNMDRVLTSIICGSLMVLFLYYLFSFLVQGRDRYHLYFSGLVFLVILRLILEGDKLLFTFIPNFSWEWSMKLEYLTFIWLLPLFAYVISLKYNQQANLKFTKLYSITVLLGSAVILLTPSYVYTQYLVLFQATLVLGFAYVLRVILKARKEDEPYSFINLVGLLVLLMAGLNDVLYYNDWIRTESILSIGFLVFLLIQIVILVIQHANTIEQYRTSSTELKALNAELEEKVNARTQELEKSQQDLLEKNRFLHKISYLDELTHIPNRRSFANVLKSDLSEAQEKGESIALLLIDLDLFKKINDQYGHQMGDACLKIFAELLNQHFSKLEGFVARYGGEEFVVICRGQRLERLVESSNELREKVLKLKVPGVSQGELTVSVGISYAEKADITSDVLFEQADAALYKAKDQGRNQVIVFDK
ncbi:GGDEF domain-containing protein [Piscibacillus halophilus]|uniref:Diguanylate cyclase (GGDEF) domain-containing protein n=1 Tax=Piscibacillus halophilus TaxID=571933 RepID=A0A1H9DJU5_9BACI|nr:diguanylate cyclase [Piscibacillus halophilus]SEQ13033.1 diguanylate cyclase (GGDEF) domain-containing protein [Piscibacillus halophilus]